MTDEQRLEAAEDLFKAISEMGNGKGRHGEDLKTLAWLIEQAELLQLERQGAALANKLNSAYIKEVMDENKRFREALSQIAHGDTWVAYPHDIAKWALEESK